MQEMWCDFGKSALEELQYVGLFNRDYPGILNDGRVVRSQRDSDILSQTETVVDRNVLNQIRRVLYFQVVKGQEYTIDLFKYG